MQRLAKTFLDLKLCGAYKRNAAQKRTRKEREGFLALDTRTPYRADWTGADAGKIAHYLLRWVNTRGEKGPWSETV